MSRFVYADFLLTGMGGDRENHAAIEVAGVDFRPHRRRAGVVNLEHYTRDRRGPRIMKASEVGKVRPLAVGSSFSPDGRYDVAVVERELCRGVVIPELRGRCWFDLRDPLAASVFESVRAGEYGASIEAVPTAWERQRRGWRILKCELVGWALTRTPAHPDAKCISVNGVPVPRHANPTRRY